MNITLKNCTTPTERNTTIKTFNHFETENCAIIRKIGIKHFVNTLLENGDGQKVKIKVKKDEIILKMVG